MSDLGLPPCTDICESLIQAYAEPHRHYHNLLHLIAVLEELDRSAALAKRKPEVELALWFHDAVYQPFSAKNEANSAAWACHFLKRVGAPDAMVEFTERLIMATAHGHPVSNHDEKLIIDIDLSILGQPSSRYQRFSRDVRKEYQHVPGIVYRRKRKAVLAGFLKQPHIYYFEAFRSRLEITARENLRDELAAL